MLNPSRGCQREGSLGGRKKATAEAGWHFPGAFAHPQDTCTCQEAFAWLGKSLVYCCPFQLNFLPLSILDKSLYVTAALWIMLKQTCQPAKEKHVADLRLQCSVHAQLNSHIEVLYEHSSSNWAIPRSRRRNSKPGQPSRLAEVPWDDWGLSERVPCSER